MSGVAVGVTRGLTKRFGGPGGGVLAVDGLDLDVPAGSVFGLLGSERRRQDDDAPPHHRASPRRLRLGDDRRRRRGPARSRRTSRRRRPRPGSALLRLDDRARAGRTRRPARRAWMPGRARTPGRGDAGAGRPRRRRPTADRRLLGRDAPASRDRPGARRRAEPAGPGRAGQLARPGGPARPARADRRPARAGDDHLLDPRPRRRRADLRPRRDPGPRPARDRRAARRLLARYAQPLYRLDPEPGQAEAVAAARRRAARPAPGWTGWRRRAAGLVVSVTRCGHRVGRAAAGRRRWRRAPGRVRTRPAVRSRTSSCASSGADA